MIYKLVLGLVCAYFLIKEYYKIQGIYLKAKIFHFISSMGILLYYSDVITGIFKLIKNFKNVIAEWTVNLNHFEAILNVINNVIYLILGFFIFVYGIGLIYRVEKVRQILTKLILYFIPITALNIYMLSKARGNNNSLTFLILGLILSIIIFGSISYLYRRKFMIDFFNTNAVNVGDKKKD